MSLHLIPASRRQFLRASLAGGIATIATRFASAAEDASSVAPWALLADTHISQNREAVNRDTNMFDNLSRIIDEILAEDPLPAGAVINGDCAYIMGLPKDYEMLQSQITKLVDAGIPVHMTMGNHDNRRVSYDTLESRKSDEKLVAGKHVAVIDAGPVHLFLVDSLMKVNVVTGEIGQAQREWLNRALAERSDKPAIVMGHHNPLMGPVKVSGIKDTDPFFDVLHQHPHVSAYIFGHTHDWKLYESDQGLQLINQPPCAYTFHPSRPSGWVRMTVSDERLTLELRALDQEHPQHAERHELLHRALAEN